MSVEENICPNCKEETKNIIYFTLLYYLLNCTHCHTIFRQWYVKKIEFFPLTYE